jgi:hypothetical protein
LLRTHVSTVLGYPTVFFDFSDTFAIASFIDVIEMTQVTSQSTHLFLIILSESRRISEMKNHLESANEVFIVIGNIFKPKL